MLNMMNTKHFHITGLHIMRRRCHRWYFQNFKRGLKLDQEAYDEGLLEEHLLKRTMEPLSHLEYEDQINKKQRFVELSIKKFANISKFNKGIPTPEMKQQILNNDGYACPVDPIKHSPVLTEYRNKDNYSIGAGINGDVKAVGFYARSKLFQGMKVVNGVLKSHRRQHYELSKLYKEFLYTTSFDICPPPLTSGHWRNITVRSNEAGNILVSAAFHPRGATESDMKKAQEELYEFFIHGPGRSVDIDSLYFHQCESIHYTSEGGPFTLLHGNAHLQETLLGQDFRISPDAFWQLNTKAAEVLYNTVKEYANLDSNTTLLDICCGTGTIGIALAKSVKKVIGIEKVKQAVDDANFNATQNGITNAEFICGVAEKDLKHLKSQFTEDDDTVVAVVNPGRGGLGWKVTRALRRFTPLKKIIYISCKPHGRACYNFTELIQAEAEKYPNTPFMPVRAVAVDMFPHTYHYDLVLAFER